MDELREKCPWDRKQTIESLRSLTIEETYELADAITDGDYALLKEELGDLLLHIIFYAKCIRNLKCHSLFTFKDWREDHHWRYIELPNGERRTMTTEERNNPDTIPEGSKVFIPLDLRPSGYFTTGDFVFEFNGTKYSPGTGKSWRTNKEGMDNLAKYNRLYETSKALTYVLYHDDYPVSRITNFWNDTEGAYQASGLSRFY